MIFSQLSLSRRNCDMLSGPLMWLSTSEFITSSVELNITHESSSSKQMSDCHVYKIKRRTSYVLDNRLSHKWISDIDLNQTLWSKGSQRYRKTRRVMDCELRRMKTRPNRSHPSIHAPRTAWPTSNPKELVLRSNFDIPSITYIQ
jgi:hypothetical protein